MRLRHDYDCRVFRAGIDGPGRLERAVERIVARHTANAGGVVRAIRPGTADDYPRELDDRLSDLEPQFFLRNVPRAEKYIDDLELNYVQVREAPEDAHAIVAAAYRPPEFVEQNNADRIGAHRREMRRLFFEADWTRHFGYELKTKLSELHRAVWNYDPDRETL